MTTSRTSRPRTLTLPVQEIGAPVDRAAILIAELLADLVAEEIIALERATRVQVRLGR